MILIMVKHKSVARMERYRKKNKREEEQMKRFSEISQDNNVSMEDNLASDEQNLVHSRWQPNPLDTDEGEGVEGVVQIEEVVYIVHLSIVMVVVKQLSQIGVNTLLPLKKRSIADWVCKIGMMRLH